MQLTGPLFLFLFLPVCLPLALFWGRRYRAAALAILSLAWFLLVNRHAAWGLFAVLIPLFCAFFAPRRKARWVRLLCGAVVPIVWCLVVRVAAEYTALAVYYPFGLTVLSLHAAYLSLSPARPRTVWGTLSYLFFFPVLTAGPALDPAQWETALADAAFALPRFSAGIVQYARGFTVRVALCATLFRILAEWQNAGAGLSLTVLLPVSFFALFTFFAGTRDMAAGLAAMCGVTLPERPVTNLTAAQITPLFWGREAARLYPCKDGFLRDLPLFLTAAALVRPRPLVLLSALPFFAAARIPAKTKRARACRAVLLGFCAAVFSAAVTVPSFAAWGALFATTTTPHAFVTAILTHATARYLYISLILLALLPLVRFADRAVRRRATARQTLWWQAAKTVTVFLAFLFTLLFFLPQYPLLADGLPLYL